MTDVFVVLYWLACLAAGVGAHRLLITYAERKARKDPSR